MPKWEYAAEFGSDELAHHATAPTLDCAESDLMGHTRRFFGHVHSTLY